MKISSAGITLAILLCASSSAVVATPYTATLSFTGTINVSEDAGMLIAAGSDQTRH
jgi:hypothetical protein